MTAGGEDDIRKAAEGAEPPQETADESLDLRLAKLSRNDYGNAQRLIERHGKELLYVQNAGWHCWDGKRWVGDQEGARRAHLLAHKTALGVAAERLAVLNTPNDRFGGEKAKDALVDGLRKWAIASGNSARVTAMLNEARPYLERRAEEMDADPYLFNVENGTLDLRGGVKFVRHSTRHRITHLAPVKYLPGAGCPQFHRFLDDIIPGREEQAFLQRYFGYCLTGDIAEQKMLLCWGSGANGKSTLILAVMKVLGDYASTLAFESLQYDGNKRGGEASPDLARLPGKRLVYAPEPEANVRLSTSTIKRFTSREPIQVRKLYEEETTFVAQFKLCLSFNPKPSVPSQDEGTWRRLAMMHFAQTIPDERKDPELLDKLEAERAGILNWLLDGFRLWREDKLALPASVLADTMEYRDENDPLGQFARHCLVMSPGVHTGAKEIYTSYKAWCEENNAAPFSQKKLGVRLKEMGFKSRVSGITTYLDTALAEDAPGAGTGRKSTPSWEGDL